MRPKWTFYQPLPAAPLYPWLVTINTPNIPYVQRTTITCTADMSAALNAVEYKTPEIV
jgi:hypothetical protein